MHGGQRHRLARTELTIGTHEGLATIRPLRAELGEMAAGLGAVTAVAIADLAPHRHPVGRHGEPKEPLCAVGSVIATVAKRD
jgi:hypothetical protein